MEGPVVLLSTAERSIIDDLAYPLPPACREAFVTAVLNALAAYPVHDVGLAHRVARELLPSFYRPPEPTHPPAQHNARRMQTAARSTGISSHVRRDAR
jgi:hypothetical protein